jgi:hypothetical protein
MFGRVPVKRSAERVHTEKGTETDYLKKPECTKLDMKTGK